MVPNAHKSAPGLPEHGWGGGNLTPWAALADVAVSGYEIHHGRTAQHPAMAMQEELPDAVMSGRGFSPTGSDPSKATAAMVFQNGKLVRVKAKTTASPKAGEQP